MQKIIDIHAHTTNHKLWGLHTESATIEDLEKLAAKYNVEKICLMATYFPLKGSGLHNIELLNRIGDKKLFKMFASLDVTNDFEKGLEGLATLLWTEAMNRIAGIKLYLGYQEFNPADEKYQVLFQLAEEHNLPVVCHTGYLHHCCPEDKRKTRCGGTCKLDQLQHLSNPKVMIKVCQAFPDVKFNLSHLGNPYFDDLLEIMEQCPNTYTDISGSDIDDPEYRPQVAEVVYKIMQLPNGEKRLMFGTDFPIQSYEDTINFVESLALSNEFKEKIYWQNAEQFLRRTP